MPDITLADGLPVWEGAAVRYGSPGDACRGRFFVHDDPRHPGSVYLGGQRYAPPGALVLDLDHLPTLLHLAYLTAEKWQMHVTVEPGAPLEFYTYDLAAEVTVTDADDLRSLWLNGPAL